MAKSLANIRLPSRLFLPLRPRKRTGVSHVAMPVQWPLWQYCSNFLTEWPDPHVDVSSEDPLSLSVRASPMHAVLAPDECTKHVTSLAFWVSGKSLQDVVLAV